MPVNSLSRYINCSFNSEVDLYPHAMLSTADVFYADSKDVNLDSPGLKEYINIADRLKADRFHNSEDKNTYLVCHTLLRMILSKRLNLDPHDILYLDGTNGKPRIKGDPLYFNISHTRNSFAIAVSEQNYIGIDLEQVNEHINIEPIINRYFSANEREFILKAPSVSRNKFFLLWTRKEAFLKAIGTGLIPHISHIEVFRSKNLLDRVSFSESLDPSISSQHYIYSRKLNNYYLSVAVPQKTKIMLYYLNEKYLKTF